MTTTRDTYVGRHRSRRLSDSTPMFPRYVGKHRKAVTS